MFRTLRSASPLSALKLSRSAAIRDTPFSSIQARFLTTSEYHHLADQALEDITESYEKLIDEKPEIDIDLSQGVLTLVMPPVGTYVINKQPPNSQIWLSSPISGPKRYDWDASSESWVYERDQSTLGALLKEETRESKDAELELDLK